MSQNDPKRLARQEQVKRLSLDGKTQEEIAAALKVARKTVQRDLSKIRKEAIQEIKQTELTWTIKDSLDQRNKLLEAAWLILNSPTPTTKTGVEKDDRFLRLKAIEVINSLNETLDSLFGIDDLALRKELDALKTQLGAIRAGLQSQKRSSRDPSPTNATGTKNTSNP